MSTRDVNLVIRARDEASKNADAIAAAMERMSVAADAVAGSAKRTGGQLAQLAVDTATLERGFANIDGAAKRAEAAFERQQRALADTRAAYAANKAQTEAAAAALANLRAQQGAAGVDQATLTAKIDAAEQAYRGLTRETSKLGGSIREQESSLTRSASSLQRIGSQAIGAEAALKRARDATKGAPGATSGGLFGLKAHELQNLSFQVNDLITQIGSGTSVTQALAQQGGQVFQIFQSRLGGLIKYLPALGGVAAALAPVILGLDRLFARQSALAEFNGALAASGDSATYSGAKLSDAAHGLDQYGASADDAKAAVKAFVSEGVDPSQIQAFGEAALNASEVLGVKLTDAAKDSARAFTGGYQAISEFDDKVNFLTESERGLIRQMFESGDASEAREKAFRIFFDRMQDGADKARGEWANSVRALQGAWSGFLDYLASTQVVSSVGTALTDAARGAAYLLNKLSGSNALQTAAQDVNLFTNRIAALRDNIAKFGDPFGVKARSIAEYTKNLAAAQSRLAQLQAQQGPTSTAPGADPKADTEQAKKKHADRLVELKRERAGIGAVTNAQAVQIAGERAYRAEIEKTGDAVAANFAKQTAILKEQARIAKEREREIKGTTALISPATGPITSGFGKRKPPIAGASAFHLGNDIGVPVGTPVKAVADGRATVTRSDKGGLTVTLDLGSGYKAAFAHLSESLVKTGDVVAQGAVIAKSGNGGSASTGAHLHYSLSQNGTALDPSKTPRIKVASGTPYQEAAVDADKLAQQTLETQTKLNIELADDANKRSRIAQNQSVLNGLTGEGLLAGQRQQAIDDAIATARDKVAQASESIVKAGGEALNLSSEQADRIGAAAAAEYDAAHAREAATQ